jgi:hypothetical protein
VLAFFRSPGIKQVVNRGTELIVGIGLATKALRSTNMARMPSVSTWPVV